MWIPFRKLLVRVRDANDRRLHPERRRRAEERLTGQDPSKVLFICLGNICRSPYAEHRLRGRADDGVSIASAGFILPGRPPPENAVEAAGERGIHTGDHRSQVVTADLARAADAVFIFDRFNAKALRRVAPDAMSRVFWLGDFDPVWTGKRAIADPWGKPLEEFRATFERIDRCVEEVVAVIGASSRGRATGGSP